MKRLINLIVMLAFVGGVSFALADESDTMRTLFCRENRLPDLHMFEFNTIGTYKKFEEKITKTGSTKIEHKEYTVTPELKYGIYDNLTIFGRVPFTHISSDDKGSSSGFNDISFGLELLAYEYTYKYPWIIPYFEVILPTGDDKKYRGNGEADAVFGTAIGTTTFDVYHWVLDGRYNFNYQNRSKDKTGLFTGSAAFIWDLSDQFSVLTEGKITDEDVPYEDFVPIYLNCGMSYKPVPRLTISWYGGYSWNSGQKESASIKIAYSF